MVTFAPAARAALSRFFLDLATRDASGAESLRRRLESALQAAAGGVPDDLPLVLPGGRSVYRLAVPPLGLVYEQVVGGSIRVLLVDS